MKPPKATTVLNAGPPVSRKEAVDAYLTGIKRYKEKLLADIIRECVDDPRFLDKVLKELKPLRKRGRIAQSSSQTAIVDHFLKTCPGWKPSEIVETLAKTLNVSEPHARRLYDSARKRS